MRLSEAIWIGAKLRPQAFNTEFDGTGTCAFGAAHEARGIEPHRLRTVLLPPEWQWVHHKSGICPGCGSHVPTVAAIISSHLNDAHRWTRERISLWVTTIEPHDEIPPLGETERSSPVSAGSGSGVP